MLIAEQPETIWASHSRARNRNDGSSIEPVIALAASIYPNCIRWAVLAGFCFRLIALPLPRIAGRDERMSGVSRVECGVLAASEDAA